jgi:hypothetical protein
VLVTRTGGSGEKEGQLKAVFLDEIGTEGRIDKGEFHFSRWGGAGTEEFDDVRVSRFVELVEDAHCGRAG